MQQYSNTGGCSPLEGVILSCSEKVKVVAWKFSRLSSRVDREEMYSIGMLAVCEAAASGGLAHAAKPVSYLVGAARFAMIREYRRMQGRDWRRRTLNEGWSTESLDARLSTSCGSSFSLADLLPAPTPVSVSSDSKRVCALYDALWRLPVRKRVAVERRAGLPGYGAYNREETVQALHITSGTVNTLDYEGRRKLARDAQLCKVMGVEVQA